MQLVKKVLSLILVLVMVLGLMPATVFATGTNSVYISVSYDGKYINDKNGNAIAYIPVSFDELASIDLDAYSLGDYKYDEDGDGTYDITALHMVIYAHENLYGGSWSDVTFTGGAGSSYFQGGIFGFDENLNYYLNGEYPLAGEGWGATSDQIVLEAGDFLDIASFSSWDFYMDSNYGFHFFADENVTFTHNYTAEAGTALPIKLVRSFSAMGVEATVYDGADYTISYGTSYGNATGTVTTDGSGCAEITFPSAGTWILWADGGYGNEYPDAIVSSPAYAKVTVSGGNTGDNQGSEPEKVTTTLKVTADEGITLSADISICSNCMDVIDSVENTSTIEKTIEWSCPTHGSESASWYNIKVTANSADNYNITGITVNGEKYIINPSDDINDWHDLGGDSYIEEKTASAVLELISDTAPENMVIHIHAEKEDESGTDDGGTTPEPPRQSQSVSTVLNATMTKLAATVTEPVFGTTAGEWTVLSLARGGYYAKDNAYFADYYDRIVETVNTTAASVNLNGALHKSKSTENSRLIAALSAIGKNATSVGDWDLVEAYSANGYDWIKKQGLNGTIWALIALDSNNYETRDDTIRQQCVDAILAAQHDDGGWSLMANKSYASDPDITGMALTALYPYRDQAAVMQACTEAFNCLSDIQNENGTYTSGGSECAESCSWVIVATTTWGINPDTNSRFIKNGNSVVDGLLAHYLSDSATFQHIIGAGSNAMATDQSCYALVAYDRFLSGEPALFDYSDVSFEIPEEPEAPTDPSDPTDPSEPENPTDPTEPEDPDSSDSLVINATLGLPDKIENKAGNTFNAVISIDNWDNTANLKLIDFLMTVPKGLKVTGVAAGARFFGGDVTYHLDENGNLRCVYFDANENTDLRVSGTEFPAEVFTVSFEIQEELTTENLTISINGMSVKLSSDSTDENAMIIVGTDPVTDPDDPEGGTTGGGSGNIGVVVGVSFSAVELYTGDDVDLIPSTKKAVAVAVTGITNGSKLRYNDGTNQIEFLYNAAITEKTGVSSYVALVDSTIDMNNFVNDNYFTVGSDNANTLTFGDSNGDGVVNAQDALAAVDAWLRKGEAPTDICILTLNVNGDSRLNTFDALGIVEAFVNGSTYGVVTKAATITTKQ